MKICNKCEIKKDFNQYHKYKASKDGYKNICKECRKPESKKYQEENKEKISIRQKEYRTINKDRLSKYGKDRKLAIRNEKTKGTKIELLDNEVAVDIKDYEGYYQITNFGRVISFPDTSHCNYRLKEYDIFNKGYPRVSLFKDGKCKHFFIHRLVAIHFIPNPLNKPHINHINAVVSDFSISNLEWCTPKENVAHAIKLGNMTGTPNIKHKINTSGLIGVCFHKRLQKWQSRIRVDKKRINIGYFTTKEEAGVAYDEMALKHFGKNGNFNFI